MPLPSVREYFGVRFKLLFFCELYCILVLVLDIDTYLAVLNEKQRVYLGRKDMPCDFYHQTLLLLMNIFHTSVIPYSP